jgi:hypothetical protein
MGDAAERERSSPILAMFSLRHLLLRGGDKQAVEYTTQIYDFCVKQRNTDLEVVSMS